jgi:hypothetical protein
MEQKEKDKRIFIAGEEIPNGLDYAYVVGRDGVYLKKRTALFEAIVKVDKIPTLDEMKSEVMLIGARIPYSIIVEAARFFRAVFAKYQSEAMAFLVLEQNTWQIIPVRQEVAGLSVSYENSLHKEGKRASGTIHSHCNMGASFSGIDDGDDQHADGIHITLGKIMEELPDIACSVVVNGNRFNVSPEFLISDLPSMNPDHPWLANVTRKDSQMSMLGYPYSQKDEQKKPDTVQSPELKESDVKALIGNINIDELGFRQKVALYNQLREVLCAEADSDPRKAEYIMDMAAEKGEDYPWL